MLENSPVLKHRSLIIVTDSDDGESSELSVIVISDSDKDHSSDLDDRDFVGVQ